jgi:PAS domain-containing protein
MDDIWITTDAAGFVMGCSPSALELLGYSARGARGRELPNMFIRERPRLAELLQAAQGEAIERDADFRPNDRKAIRVRFRITIGERMPSGAVTLLWTFFVRWPVGMRLPSGVDRRQLITIWRSGSLRCVFVPGGADKRRLFVCGSNDEIVHEEHADDVPGAFARAAELQKLAREGVLSLD